MKTMSTLVFKRILVVTIISFFAAADFGLSIFAFADIAQAAVQAQQVRQGEQQEGEIPDEEEEPDDELSQDDLFIDELLTDIAPINQTVQQGKLLFKEPAPLVIHPFDQVILDLYVDPEASARKLTEPGSDKQAFDEVMNELFGFRPSLDQFPDEEKTRNTLLDVFTDKSKTEKFIKTLEDQLAAEKFVTEANRTILQETIIPAAKRVQTLYTGETKTLPRDQVVVKDVVNIILDQITKVERNAETFSPLIVSLAAAVEPLPLDRRVVKSLIYLVTPREQGGAGHERIKVERIWKDYSDPDENSEKNISREVKDADNISRHRFGQAIDISEIDNVKCTLIKRGRVLKKKTPRPPIPIKVAFQSEDSLRRTVEGSSELPLGFTMYEVFKEMALGSIIDGISDLDLEDLEEGSLRDATLNDILLAVGEQMVAKAIGFGPARFEGFDFNSIINQVGQAMIADKLGIPRYAVKGSSLEEMEASIGRTTVEERLGLPPLALQGNSRQEIIRSVGARKLERILRLRRGSLSFPGLNQTSPEQIQVTVGQGYIEEAMRLRPGSFAPDRLDEIQRRLGDFRFKTVFTQNPQNVDTTLKIASGSTARFLATGNAYEYKLTVGQRLMDSTFKVFGDYQENVLARFSDINDQLEPLKTLIGARQVAEIDDMAKLIDELLNGPRLPGQSQFMERRRLTPITIEEVKNVALQVKKRWEDLQKNSDYLEALAKTEARNRLEVIAFNLDILVSASNLNRQTNRKDESFGTPKGSLDKLLSGNLSQLDLIGASELAQRLSFSEPERQLLYNWFGSGSGELGPVEPSVTASFGMSIADFRRVFSSPAASEPFRAIGERRLLRAVQHLPEVKRFEQQYLNDLRQTNPELFALVSEVDFRLDRIRDIRRDLDRLEQLIGATDETRQIKDIIERALRNPAPSNLNNAAKQISRIWDRLDQDQKVQTRKEAKQVTESIRRNFRAVIDGEFPRSASSLAGRDLFGNPANRDPGLSLSFSDLLDLITKKKSPQDVALTVGLRKVEFTLGLPAESLFLYSKEQVKSPENFFASVGKAKIQERYGRGQIKDLIERNATRADTDLNLKRGTSASFLGQTPGQSLPQQRYLEIVGRQTLIFGAVRRITGDLRVDGLVFSPEDIYLMLNGSGQNTFARMAGYKLDEKLRLYPGSAERIISARNTQERNDAVAIASGALLGRYLGIGPIDLRGGDPMRSTGVMIIENTLGFREGAVRKSKTLQELEQADPKTLDKLFGETAEDVALTDRLLRLETGTTQKLHDGKLSLDQYTSLVGKQNLQNQLLNSNRVTGFLLGALGIDEESEMAFRLRSFVFGDFGIIDMVVRNAGKAINQWSRDDKVNIFTSLEGLFGLEFDRRARLRPGTFADIFANPDQASQILVREGIYGLDNQLNLGGKLETAYNFFMLRREQRRQQQVALSPQARRSYDEGHSDGIQDARNGISYPQTGPAFKTERVNDPDYKRGYDEATTPKGQRPISESEQPRGVASFIRQARQQAVERAQVEAIAQIQQFAFNSFGVALSAQDIRGITQGNTKVFQYIGFAEGAKRFNELIGARVPTEYQLRIEDFRLAFEGGPPDQSVINAAGEKAAAAAIDDVVNGRVNREQIEAATGFAIASDQDLQIATDQYAVIQRDRGKSEAAAKLKQDYQRNLQYKMFDIVAYQADSNIPLGFAAAMLEGTSEMRFETMLGYLENRLRTGFGLPIAQGSLDALNDYFRNRTQDNYQRLLSTGIFRSLEGFLNQQKVFGFQLPGGTLEGLFRFGAGRDPSQLEGIGRQLIFQWADQSFKFPFGTSFQIYSLTKDMLAGQQALAALSGASLSTQLIGTTAGVVGSVGATTGLGGPLLTSMVTNASGAGLAALQAIGPQTALASGVTSISSAAGNAITTTQGLSLNLATNVGRKVTDRLTLSTTGTVTAKQGLSLSSAAARESARKAAQARVGAAQAALASFVVTTVFQKQLTKTDQALGLVPGSMGIVVGQLILMAFPAASNPVTLGIAIGMFLLLNIFGFTKIRLTCTGDGYYPTIEQLNEDLYLGLGEFDGMNPQVYRQGLLGAAQGRVQGLIEDLLNMAYRRVVSDDKGNIIGFEQIEEVNKDLKPIQILTRRKEDFEAFFGSDLYSEVFNDSPPGPSNRQGILTGQDFFVDNWVHVGF